MVHSTESIFQVQSLDIVIEDDNFVGMPFVLLSGGRWIKNQGSDFYVDFGSASKPALKVSLLPNIFKCYLLYKLDLTFWYFLRYLFHCF